jgi:CheY-like chemotaxis protein
MKDQFLRVLLVEDSENDARLILRRLKKGGYDPVYERVKTAAAMNSGQLDAVIAAFPAALQMVNHNAGLRYLPQHLSDEEVGCVQNLS